MKIQRRHDQVADSLTRDGVTVVLVRRTLVKLSDVAAQVFNLTEHPVELGRLAQELESQFGAPPVGSSVEATEEAVRQLVHHGLLKVVAENEVAR